MINETIKKETTKDRNIIMNILAKIFSINTLITLFIIAIVICRTPIELKYRQNFNKVHCIADQMRMNSLYDNTIGTYGLDDILKNKKVYIVQNLYGMTDFYCDYYFRIYDKKNEGNKIIVIKDLTELPSDANDENSIILTEDILNNTYSRFYLKGVLYE